MKNFRWWSVLGLGVLSAALSACGGGSDDGGSGRIRLVNATLTHASLDLVKTDDSDPIATSVAAGAASDFSDLGSSGSTGLQVNDAGSATPLATTSANVPDGKHYSLYVFESNGTVKTAQIAEDTDEPDSGTSQVRMLSFATDAGALDVYVTDASVDIATVSPNFQLAASTTAVSSGFVQFTPKAYRVRVYGQGSKTDLRLDIPSVTFGDQEVSTFLLTPAAGGVLLNGGNLVQQGDYAQSLNTTARVRLAAAATNNGTVAATAGNLSIDGSVNSNGTQSPSVGDYVVVPAASALSVTVNGDAVTVPTGGLKAGTDSTLFVYDNPNQGNGHTATLLLDDNHLFTQTGNYKMRLVNGLTGTATTLTLRAGAVQIANNVQPGAASSYTNATGNTSGATTGLLVSSPFNADLYSPDSQTILGASVYTLFMFGTLENPFPFFVQDNTVNSGQ